MFFPLHQPRHFDAMSKASISSRSVVSGVLLISFTRTVLVIHCQSLVKNRVELPERLQFHGESALVSDRQKIQTTSIKIYFPRFTLLDRSVFVDPALPFTCPAYAAKRLEAREDCHSQPFLERAAMIYRLSLKEKRIGPIIGNLNVLDAARQFPQCLAFGSDDALSTTALGFEYDRLCRRAFNGNTLFLFVFVH